MRAYCVGIKNPFCTPFPYIQITAPTLSYSVHQSAINYPLSLHKHAIFLQPTPRTLIIYHVRNLTRAGVAAALRVKTKREAFYENLPQLLNFRVYFSLSVTLRLITSVSSIIVMLRQLGTQAFFSQQPCDASFKDGVAFQPVFLT